MSRRPTRPRRPRRSPRSPIPPPALADSDNNALVYSAVTPSYLYEDGTAAIALNEWRETMQRVEAALDPDSTATIPDEQTANSHLGTAKNTASPQDYEVLAAKAQHETSGL